MSEGTRSRCDDLPCELLALANHRNQMDGVALMRMFPTSSVPLVIFDPQYRGVLERLSYGNEGARQKQRAALVQMPEALIHEFLVEIDRALVPSGHLMLWVDKFHLVEGIQPWVAGLGIRPVDLITWDKQNFGMGYRTRRKAEYLLVLQKPPQRAKGVWMRHDIADVWSEKFSNVTHAHAKPEGLQAALISAVTKDGDFVVDPAAGGYSVWRAAQAAGRPFIGCDLEG